MTQPAPSTKTQSDQGWARFAHTLGNRVPRRLARIADARRMVNHSFGGRR